jgi:MFS family permease
VHPNHPEITRALAAERIAALLAKARRARDAAEGRSRRHGSTRAVTRESASLQIANDTPGSADRQGVSAPSWLRVGLAVAAVAWGANQFAPLLLLYRQRLHLSAAMVDATFGLYAAGLIPALLIGGHLADRYGRRRILVSALAVSFPATLSLIAGGDSLPMLFIGRLLGGIASGLAFGSGAAWIKELSARPGSLNAGARRATIAMTFGFAGGPLVAGLTAQWGPWRWGLPYLPHLVLTLLAIPVIATAQETRGHGRTVAAHPRLPLTRMQRRRYLTLILPMAPWVFVSAAIGLAYLPGLIDQQLHSHALLIITLIVTLTATTGIAVQPGARRLAQHDARWLLVGALTTVTVGLVAASAAASTMSIPAAVVSAGILGAGYGACQVHGLQEVQLTAPAERLASVTATYQAASYLGFAAPFMLAYAQHIESPQRLLLLLAMLAIATTIVAAVQDVRTRPPRPRPPGPGPGLRHGPPLHHARRPQAELERRSARSATCLNAHQIPTEVQGDANALHRRSRRYPVGL